MKFYALLCAMVAIALLLTPAITLVDRVQESQTITYTTEKAATRSG